MPVTDAILDMGAGGFIGQHLVRALAQQGYRVIAASRSATDFRLAHVKGHFGELREPEDFLPLVTHCRAVGHLTSISTPSICLRAGAST